MPVNFRDRLGLDESEGRVEGEGEALGRSGY